MKVIVGKGIVEEPSPVPITRLHDNFLEAYLKYVEDQEAAEKVHIWTALSVIAGALERKVWLKRRHYDVFPNLYVVIVGSPGLAKKSTATGIGVGLLRELSAFNFVSEQITDAALVESMSEAFSTFSHKGRDVKQSALFFYGSELSVTLKNCYGSIPELLTTFFDCQPNDPNKPWVRSSKGSGSTRVYGPCLNMLGCTTPTWLKDSIPADQMDGGFASRIIFVAANEMPTKFNAIPEHNPEGAELQAALVNDLKIIHSLTGEMTMTEQAKAAFKVFYERNQKDIFRRADDTRFCGYFGRKSTLVEKVAMCLSVAESSKLVITEGHVCAAITLLERIEVDMFASLQHIGKNPLANAVHRLQTILANQPYIPQPDIYKMFYRDFNPNEIQSIILQLQQMGVAHLAARDGKTFLVATKVVDEVEAELESEGLSGPDSTGAEP